MDNAAVAAADRPSTLTLGAIAPEEAGERRRLFSEFLSFQDHINGSYQKKVEQMLQRGDCRLVINLDDMRVWDEELTTRFLRDPEGYLPYFREALRDMVNQIRDTYGTLKSKTASATEEEYYVGVEGSFGAFQLTPRTLSTVFIRSLVRVEGIVTRCSVVRPKLVLTAHWCEATSMLHYKRHFDATSANQIPNAQFGGAMYPTADAEGNPLVTEFGLSQYKDYQTLTIQEMPERAPAGQLPRSVDVIVEHDLVDRCKPGDRVQIVGVYRALPSKMNGGTKGVYKTILLANHIELMAKDIKLQRITDKDVEHIKAVAALDDAFERLSRSLAPSIYGHEYIKKALLLLLLGGGEKNLENGTHIRGDINILLVGDPSTAKSQLLRFALSIAPLAINTTGRGSSGVGLTAAVTTDRDTGERRLEAGAMVLADRGIVCIDEFDKMSEDDRVAIHEVMEQQTVTINKAGIHTTLNARCSVFAAANPVYGQYNRERRPADNIALPDSLLSRFDLLFIVLDVIDPEHDREIADHVLRMHMYRPPGEEEGAVTPLEHFHGHGVGHNDSDDTSEFEDEEGTSRVYQKFDRTLHGSRGANAGKLFSIPFLKKYIHYVKSHCEPTLSDEAREVIAEAWAELRGKEAIKTLPITPRTLETLIRLSVAHARCRLKADVDVDDVKAALEILNFALFHEAAPRKRQQPIRSAPTRESESVEAAPVESSVSGPTPAVAQQPGPQPAAVNNKGPTRRGRKRKREEDEDDDEIIDTGDTVSAADADSAAQEAQRQKAEAMEIDSLPESHRETTATTRTNAVPMEVEEEEELDISRIAEFKRRLGRLAASRRGSTAMPIAKLLEEINKQRGASGGPFDKHEAERILVRMEDEVYYAEGEVHFLQ